MHLNRKSNGLLFKSFDKFVKAFWVPHEKVVYKDNISGLADMPDVNKLKQLRVNNPKTIASLSRN